MTGTNEWQQPAHALEYLARMHDIPHRPAGEATLLSELDPGCRRVLDLGCGNGHLLSLVLQHCPQAHGIGLDFSPTMLGRAQEKFAEYAQHDSSWSSRVDWIEHNLDERLPELGSFDAVVSSFAIHHCEHPRKLSLYAEIFDILNPGGIFCNLEHVASPTAEVHGRFLAAMQIEPEQEDPSNKLLDTTVQLGWLQQLGFEQVDCFWKWRELALLVGRKPHAAAGNS